MQRRFPDVNAETFPEDHPLRRCHGFIFDVDGVLCRGDDPIPGSPEAIDRLRRGGKKVAFISNNSTKSQSSYVEKFARLGIPVDAHDLVLSTYGTAQYVAAQKPQARVYMVGAPGLREELELAGLVLTDDPMEAEYVVVGSAFDGSGRVREDNIDRITGALRALYHAGAKFVATNPDRLFPAQDGVIPGTGAVIGALSYMLDQQPDAIIGKPSPHIVRIALERLSLGPDECAIVGDMDTDMLSGERLGMTRVFVRSGAMTEEKLLTLCAKPDFAFDAVIDMLTFKEA